MIFFNFHFVDTYSDSEYDILQNFRPQRSIPKGTARDSIENLELKILPCQADICQIEKIQNGIYWQNFHFSGFSLSVLENRVPHS